MYKLGYVMYNVKKLVEVNKGYVKDYFKDKVIDIYDDYDLGLFMIVVLLYKI